MCLINLGTKTWKFWHPTWISTPRRHIPDTFLILSRHLPDIIKATYRHPQENLQTPTLFTNLDLMLYLHISSQAVWWLGVDFIPIIKPLCGPTCKLKSNKISTQVELSSWARVWQCAVMRTFFVGRNPKKVYVNRCIKSIKNTSNKLSWVVTSSVGMDSTDPTQH